MFGCLGTLSIGGCAEQANGAPSAYDNVVPHTAEYHFDLTHSDAGSSVVDADGVLGYRFEKMCDGWVSEMRQVMILQGAEGTPINSGYSMTQWENFDGTEYRFRMRDFLDGTKVDEIVGTAVRDDDGVTVSYEVPVEVVEELPAETLFPTQHTMLLIERAMAGKTFVNDLVFDGSGDIPTSRIAAVLSGEKKASNNAEDPDNIASAPFHRMNLAFYPLGASENGPSSEMVLDLGNNGVAQKMKFSYGTFEVTGTLDKANLLEFPDCGS
ncbi:cell envelope integrity EipB family protein [Thalassospira sp. MA62]|nr:cell envelope integrity EipB family protein [Thalassospira sp. MA62]